MFFCLFGALWQSKLDQKAQVSFQYFLYVKQHAKLTLNSLASFIIFNWFYVVEIKQTQLLPSKLGTEIKVVHAGLFQTHHISNRTNALIYYAIYFLTVNLRNLQVYHSQTYHIDLPSYFLLFNYAMVMHFVVVITF